MNPGYSWGDVTSTTKLCFKQGRKWRLIRPSALIYLRLQRCGRYRPVIYIRFNKAQSLHLDRYISLTSAFNMSAHLPAAFKLCSKVSHRYFLFVSMVTKAGFPAWKKWEYAVSLSDRKLVKRECSVSSAARPYLCKMTGDENNSLLKVSTSAGQSHLAGILRKYLLGSLFRSKYQCNTHRFALFMFLTVAGFAFYTCIPNLQAPKGMIIRNRNGI